MNLEKTNIGASSNESANTIGSGEVKETSNKTRGDILKTMSIIGIFFTIIILMSNVLAQSSLTDEYFSEKETERQSELQTFYEKEMQRVMTASSKIYCDDRIKDLKKKVPLPTEKIAYLETVEGCEKEIANVLVGK